MDTSDPSLHPIFRFVEKTWEALRAAGLKDKPLYVATFQNMPDQVHRGLAGGLISGARSVTDVLDRLEVAIANGQPGLPPPESSRIMRAVRAVKAAAPSKIPPPSHS